MGRGRQGDLLPFRVSLPNPLEAGADLGRAPDALPGGLDQQPAHRGWTLPCDVAQAIAMGAGILAGNHPEVAAHRLLRDFLTILLGVDGLEPP